MPDRPNLVFIFSDQQRYDTLACYGNEWIQTPRLNALADQSFVFEAAYVTQPVCTPARASIMTGLYPHAAGPIVNKMNLPADVPTIAEMVSDEYHCGYYGKWHLGDDVIAQHGFHEWVSAEDGHRPQYTGRQHLGLMSDYHRYLVEQGYEPQTEVAGARIFDAWQRAQLPEDHQMAPFLGARAAEFIDRNSQRPFILYVSTFEPHPPYFGPLNDLYDPDQVPVGPAFLQKPQGAALVNRARADYFLQYLSTGRDPESDRYMTESAAVGNDVASVDGWRRLRARYMANITLVDRMVGSITDALERNGLADSTVVVFTSEHGEMAGDHGMLEKRSFYEEASRVPLLMRVPWLSASQRSVDGSCGSRRPGPDAPGPTGPADTQTIAGRKPTVGTEGRRFSGRWRGGGPVERNQSRDGGPAPGRGAGQPDVGPAVAVYRSRPMEAEPVRRRPVRALRSAQRPPRNDQPVQRPGPSRPHPRYGRPVAYLAGEDRGHGAAALRLALFDLLRTTLYTLLLKYRVSATKSVFDPPNLPERKIITVLRPASSARRPFHRGAPE